jgi:hypothetical protein
MVHPDKGRIVCDMDRVGLRWRTNPSGAASEGGPALVWFPRQGRHPTEGGILGGIPPTSKTALLLNLGLRVSYFDAGAP